MIIFPPTILTVILDKVSAFPSVAVAVRIIVRQRRHDLLIGSIVWLNTHRYGGKHCIYCLGAGWRMDTMQRSLGESLTQTLTVPLMIETNQQQLPVAPAAAPPAETVPETETLLITEEIECPPERVGNVIGAGGFVLQDVMGRTHCKVSVKSAIAPGHPQILEITGRFEDVQSAKSLLTSVMNGGPMALQTSAPGQDFTELVSDTLECPCDKVSLVIGSKGIVIQDIMRRSCCKIVVDQDFAPGVPRVIVINGRQSQIEIAKSLLLLVIEQGPNALHQPGVIGGEGLVTEEMECPHERVGIVIGSKGSIVQEIMKRTGCRIVVHQDLPDGVPRQVMITGTPDQVKAGRELVAAVIESGPMAVQGPSPSNPNGMIVQDLKLLQNQVGKLIGPGGSIIKDIQQRFSVRMNIDQPSPHTDERKLRITGDPPNVQAVLQYIWHLVNNGGTHSPQCAHSPVSRYGPPPLPPSPGGGGMGGFEPNQPPPQMIPFANIPHPLPPPPSPQSVGQGLGVDGSSGRLMPPNPLGNGLVHQVPPSPLPLPHSGRWCIS
jgi:rRNA processing protein Krr1/Pno1